MAYEQDGGYQISGGDLPCGNYTAADIPAGRIVLLDTANTIDTAGKPRGVVLPSAGGGVVGTFGITSTRHPAISTAGYPGQGLVRVVGSYPVIADGAITVGDYVQASDTVGKLGYAKLCAAATEQVGQAMNTVADGQVCHVLICKARNA